MLPSRALDAEFKKELGDLRYATTITVLSKDEEKYYDANVVGMTYGNKYLGTVTIQGTQRYSDNNIIVYRLADVKLMKAEALIKTNDVPSAMTIVNEIRSRAGLSAISASSQNDALNKLLNERRKEFAFEGKRWYDLLRTNKILEFKTEPEFVKNRTLLAVPQAEIDKNPKLTQNSTF
jgi:starch-binding outer membrane protein, SusD/RagB family